MFSTKKKNRDSSRHSSAHVVALSPKPEDTPTMSQPKESAGFRHLTTHRLAKDNIIFFAQQEQTLLLVIPFSYGNFYRRECQRCFAYTSASCDVCGQFLAHARTRTAHHNLEGVWITSSTRFSHSARSEGTVGSTTSSHPSLLDPSPRPTASQLFEELPQCLCACVENDSR